MRGMRLAIAGVTALFAIGLVLAAEEMPMGPPAEMSQLQPLEGAWTCTGEVPEGPLGPAHKSSTSVTIHKDLDGMWYSGRIEEARSEGNPHPLKGMVHMTWDASGGKFMLLWIDNTGGWSTQASPGWDDDRMVWLGDGMMEGKKIQARDTFTKKGADLAHLGELRIDDKWVVVQDEVCRK